jgi:hypothetical protein
MEPNFKLALDELAKLNYRFYEQDERFTDLERGITERSSSTSARLDALEASRSSSMDDLSRRVADLEAAPVDLQPLAAIAHLATLEANYADCDAEFSKRLAHLEALRVGPYKDVHGDQMATLEAAAADFAAWRPGVDGLLDDVRITVQKLEKSRDRAVFDEMPLNSGILHTPTKAAAQHAAGFTAEPPVIGHRVNLTARVSGSGVVMT